MEEIPRAVQKSPDLTPTSVGSGLHIHETIRRCHKHHCSNCDRGNGGLRARISFREVFTGADQIGASILPLVNLNFHF